MATIKSYTDIEQSRKLAEILPIESADMYFEKGIGDNYKEAFGNWADMQIAEIMLGIKTIPCWSLTALLGVLPKLHKLQHSEEGYYCSLANYKYITEAYNNPVDACYEMIIKLHGVNLL